MGFCFVVHAIMKSQKKHGGDGTMTEKELLQQIAYHKQMRDHHNKVMAHYRKRLRALREAVAEKTSHNVTMNIIERLQK